VAAHDSERHRSVRLDDPVNQDRPGNPDHIGRRLSCEVSVGGDDRDGDPIFEVIQDLVHRCRHGTSPDQPPRAANTSYTMKAGQKRAWKKESTYPQNESACCQKYTKAPKIPRP
jgi:hypothetical protein